MLTIIIKFCFIVTAITLPIALAIRYSKAQVKKTKKRIQIHNETKKSDIVYLSSLPSDYKKPELVVMKDKKVLVLNSRKEENVAEYH